MKQFVVDAISLTKPRLSRLVVITAGCGMLLAQRTQDIYISFWPGVLTILGTALIVAAANTINCVLERDADLYMERTKERPLPQKRMSPRFAFTFGMLLAVVALVLLHLYANPLTSFLGLVGFVTYVGIYTPLKRRSMTALFAGAVPGAIPPMMGWTAVTWHLDRGAWILFGILFFWQLPHFIAISIFRKEEYDSAGLKTVPGTLGVETASQHMLAYSLMLVAVSLLPYSMGLAGKPYLVASIALGMVFTAFCVVGALRAQNVKWARAVFFGSIAYLPLILGIWVLEQWVR